MAKIEAIDGIIPPDAISSPYDIDVHATVKLACKDEDLKSGLVAYINLDAQGVLLSDDESLPDDETASITGSVYRNYDGTGYTMAHIDAVGIGTEYKGKGIGSRLYKAFVKLAIAHGGATHLAGEINLDSLAVRDRLFGTDNSQFTVGYYTPRSKIHHRHVEPETARNLISNPKPIYTTAPEIAEITAITDIRNVTIDDSWSADVENVVPLR